LAAQHVKVCLTGDGSDEMFFGYSRYFGWLNKTRRYTDIPRWKQEYVKWMRKFAPERYGPLPDEPLFSRWLSTVQFMPQEERARFWKQPMGANHILEAVQTSYERLDGSPMQRARRMEIGYYLNNDILTKVDIASMLNSLETRPPFTDMRVLDAALNISEAHLYKADMGKGTFVGKAIVKDLLSDSFGNQFLHRPKMGFGMPLDKWLFEKGEVNDYLQAELMTGKLLDLFDKNEICGRLSGTVTSPAGKSGPLWTLTMLHEWLKGV
jgi:asparagine synthase (glutamine-hydrolysing)